MPTNIVGTESYTNGPIEKPIDGDTGDVWADVIETFMDKLANHGHTGADSKTISLNIDKDIEEFEAGVDITWTSEGDGQYSAALTTASGSEFDTHTRTYYLGTAGGTDWRKVHLEDERVTATTYKVYSNDNTIDLRVVTI